LRLCRKKETRRMPKDLRTNIRQNYNRKGRGRRRRLWFFLCRRFVRNFQCRNLWSPLSRFSAHQLQLRPTLQGRCKKRNNQTLRLMAGFEILHVNGV
jgi:hypothetical protein